MKLSPINLFFIKTLFWLPVAFAVWYYMAIILSQPAALLTKYILSFLMPEVIDKIWLNGYLIEIQTNIHPTLQSGASQAALAGYLSTSVNPLIYGYCMPLFTALILASPGEEGKKWANWIIGMGVLVLTQSWGISFDIFKQFIFQMGIEVKSQFQLASWQVDAVAICYQLGYLILPAVTPLVLWVAQHQDFISELAPGLMKLQKKT